MTEEFLAEVIAELFPRVEPPVDFPYDVNWRGRFASSSTRPRRGARLRARAPHSGPVCWGAVCVSLGALHRVLPRGDLSDDLERSQPRATRQTGQGSDDAERLPADLSSLRRGEVVRARDDV